MQNGIELSVGLRIVAKRKKAKRKTKKREEILSFDPRHHKRREHHSVAWWLVIAFVGLIVLLSYSFENIDLVGQATTSIPNICYDNDDGRYYEIPGKTMFDGETHLDECLSLTIIREFYCVDDHKGTYLDQNCKFGCYDGACVYP